MRYWGFLMFVFGGVGLAEAHAWAEPTTLQTSEPKIFLGSSDSVQAAPSLLERKEIKERLLRFYSHPGNPQVMNERVKKFSVATNTWIPPRRKGMLAKFSESEALFLLRSESVHPLTRLAGAKATQKFRQFECDTFLRHHFPEIYESHCRKQNATVMGNDRVDRFVSSWIAPEKIEMSLDGLPTEVDAKGEVWSDDYWRTRFGLTSYRYSQQEMFGNYHEAIASYAQPLDWTRLLTSPLEAVSETIRLWSPAEKYDLTVGDESFSLTLEQKKEGASFLGSSGDVEDWMGICHGWAAAAVMVKPPVKETLVVGARGVKVPWYPADMKAMVSLLWANGSYEANFLGSRCNEYQPKTYPNGRLEPQRCFDINPAAFHLALGNLLGNEKRAFVMDKTFDEEVWNQPVVGYDIMYFNPLKPSQQSKNWIDVSVDYDETFKRQDRFQNPLTRGKQTPTGYKDSDVKKIVGVIATLLYLEEIFPQSGPTPQPNSYARVSYLYDLELTSRQQKWFPEGGEWHQNAHPDFFWIPRRGSSAKSSEDAVPVVFSGDEVPSAELTEVAKRASGKANPLCRVVKQLLKRSTESDTILCDSASE